MTPMIRFSNYKTQSKKSLEPSPIVEPESYEMGDAYTTSREETDIGDEEEEAEESLLQRNDIPTKREEERRQIADTILATQVSKKKMLKINLHKPRGTRGFFNENDNLVDPIARCAASSDPIIFDGLQDNLPMSSWKDVITEANLPKYTMGSSHGTTVLWLRVSPTEFLVAVDSQMSQTFTANDPNNARKFELLISEKEGKFIKIIGDVFASLSGNPVRCWDMVRYVEKQMNERKREHTLFNIGELAIEYFHLHPVDLEKELKSTVYLCAWISHEKKYDVIVVADGLDKALHVLDDVFGSGSGSDPGLIRLRDPGAPKDLKALVEEMMKASGTDPYTGGPIKVFSLRKDGNCKSVYTGSLIQELYQHNQVYEDMFFNDRSMFVIILKDHAKILSPPDLKIYLERFDPEIERRSIQWLCYTGYFLVYLVQLSSAECCTNWFSSCPLIPGTEAPVRCQNYINSENDSCGYALAYASRLILDRAKRMTSFKDLFVTKRVPIRRRG